MWYYPGNLIDDLADDGDWNQVVYYSPREFANREASQSSAARIVAEKMYGMDDVFFLASDEVPINTNARLTNRWSLRLQFLFRYRSSHAVKRGSGIVYLTLLVDEVS